MIPRTTNPRPPPWAELSDPRRALVPGGTSDGVQVLAAGVARVSTPSRGGAWVDALPLRDAGTLNGAPMIACGSPTDLPPRGGFACYRLLGAHTGGEPDPLVQPAEIDYLAQQRRRA